MSRKDIPEEILDDDVADFIGAASAAKRAGKKKFTFGGKEYPVTISGDVAKQVEEKLPCPGCNGKGCELCKNKGNLEGKGVKDAEGVTTSAKMGDAKAEELTSDARRKAFKEKLLKLGYKKKTNEERLLEKMGKSSSGYDLYHKDFSSAMKHAYDHAKKKLGIEIDPDEIDDKVAMGPKKPSNGKTNSYRLMGTDKKGKSRGVQIQVANLDNKKYELNMYKEEVELEEANDEFKPHMMYDPKTGKGYKAEKPEDHERMKKLGYSHEKPEMNEAMKNTHALIDTADGNKVVAMASSEKGVKQSRSSAHLPPMSIKNKNTLKIVTLTKPQSQKSSEKMIGRALPSNMDKFPTNVSASQGKRMGEELLAKIRAKHKQEDLEENKKSALAKKLAKASAATKKGKDKVTLKKAPWDKKEEVELAELTKAEKDLISKMYDKKGNLTPLGKKVMDHGKTEELSPKQKKIDSNKNGKIDGSDLAKLRTKKEEVEMTEAEGGMKLLDAASELEKYAKKNGGIDKKDFMKAVQMLKKGLTSKLVQFVDNLDTEPREKIVDVVANNIGVKATEKMFKVRFNNRSEEVELDEDRRAELYHQSMMFTHAMQQAEFKKKDPRLAKQHDMAGKLHAKAADMHVDGHKDAKKHSDKAKKASKLLGEEVELDEGRKQILAHGGKGQYKVVSTDGAVDVVFKGKVVGKGDYDRGADSFFISMKGQKGQKSFDDAQDIADYFAKNKIKEDMDTFDVEALIESADKKDAAEMKEIVLAMNPKYNTKQVQQEVEKMAMEKYKNKTRAKKIASHVK